MSCLSVQAPKLGGLACRAKEKGDAGLGLVLERGCQLELGILAPSCPERGIQMGTLSDWPRS